MVSAVMTKHCRSKRPERASTVVTRNVLRLFFVVWAVLILFPLLWAVITSLKTQQEFLLNPWAFPASPQWSNYAVAWKEADFQRYFLNSIILSLMTIAITLFMVFGGAYAIAKFSHPFFRFLEKFYALFMMVPQMLLLIPLLNFCKDLHLLNGPMVLVTLAFLNALQGTPFYIFMVLPFMKGLNNEILEAARIDGANEFTVFGRIALPMCKPPLYIITIMSFVGIWNEYVMSITFIKDPKYYTLSAGINNLMTNSLYPDTVKFAALIIAMIPIIVVYACFQKQMQNGMSASDGVKG